MGVDLKKYRIKYCYTTGDSFHTEDREDCLELSWNTLEAAEENLNRIKEHYELYEVINGTNYYYPEKEPTKKEKELWIKEQKKKPWFVENKKFHSTNSIKLLADTGKEVQFSAPWCGYFEHLNSLEIIEDLPKVRFR